MTEEANGNQQAASTENGAKPPEIDYEAKYREAVAHSREWEKRAKDNKAAADELQQLKEAQLSEAEKTAKHIKELEAKNAAYEAEKQQNEWKLKPENRVFIHSLYNGGQAVLHRPYCSHVYFPLSASSSALISSTTWIL